MDFEGNDDHSDAEMIPIIPSTSTEAYFNNYPTSSSIGGTKSKLTVEQQAALEDPHEKDILELLQQMDDFEPLVPKIIKKIKTFRILFNRYRKA